MPGYRGHLVGGCAAFGITVCAILSYFPHAMQEHSYSVFSLFPSLLEGVGQSVNVSLPSMIAGSRQAINDFFPWVLLVVEWFLFALVGALFPDIDIKSKGQKWIYWFLLLVLIALIGKGRLDVVAFLSVLSVTPMLVNHRGLFHRLWFVVCIPLCAWYIASLSFPFIKQTLLFDTLFFIAGAVSHLWLDMGLRKMFRL